jgi:hypothetical protein
MSSRWFGVGHSGCIAAFFGVCRDADGDIIHPAFSQLTTDVIATITHVVITGSES